MGILSAPTVLLVILKTALSTTASVTGLKGNWWFGTVIREAWSSSICYVHDPPLEEHWQRNQVYSNQKKFGLSNSQILNFLP